MQRGKDVKQIFTEAGLKPPAQYLKVRSSGLRVGFQSTSML